MIGETCHLTPCSLHMNDPITLTDQLQRLRRRVRRLLILRGISLVLLVLLATTAAAVSLDWLFRLNDAGLRRLLLLVVLVATGHCAWKQLLVPLRVRLDDVALSLQIERRFPELRDRLSSSVQFLANDRDPQQGSTTLQQELVDGTLVSIRALAFEEVVEHKSVRRCAYSGLLLLASLAILVTWRQAEASRGFDRLFLFSNAEWPKRTELKFLTESLVQASYQTDVPLRVAQGESIELIVENTRGPLPQPVLMEYRRNGLPSIREPLSVTIRRDGRDQLREVGVALLTPGLGSQGDGQLSFRARGGDDVTDWYRIKVIPPPLIESLQVTLVTPAYTKRSPQLSPADVGDIEGLLGTRVTVRATLNQSVSRATLERTSQSSLPVLLEDDGQALSAEFSIETPGISNWWFVLTDRDGVEATSPTRYQVLGQPDRVPEVFFEHPTGNIQATPTAIIPLRIVVSDDLGISELRLVVSRADQPDTPPTRILLHGPAEEHSPLTVPFEWDLSKMSLPLGGELLFHAEATDGYDLGDAHVGQSAAFTLTIVSADKKKDDLASRQAALFGELATTLDQQRIVHNHVTDLKIQWDTTRQFKSEDIDLLLDVEFNQRHIISQLAADGDGLASQARQLADEIVRNQLDDPAAQRRLRRIAEDLDQLKQSTLPPLDQALSDARRRVGQDETSREKSASAHGLDGPLRTAHRHQRSVIKTLEELLGEFTGWHDRRELFDDARRLLDRQQRLNQETSGLPGEFLDRPVDRLDRQQQADLKRLGQQQQDLANQLQRLAKQVERSTTETKETETHVRQRLSEATTRLNELGTEATLREAASQLGKNLIGRASENQRQALKQLRAFRDSLQDDDAADTRELLEQFDQLRPQLQKLTKKQQALQKQTQKAVGPHPPGDTQRQALKQQQTHLQEQAHAALEKLKSLPVPLARRALRRANEAMKRATESLKNSSLKDADSPQREAVEALQQTHRALDLDQQQTRQQLASRQADQLARSLLSLKDKQSDVLTQTRKLDDQYRSRKRWSRPLLKSLREATSTEDNLQTETLALLEKIEEDNPVADALSSIAKSLAQATRRLKERATGSQTQQTQQRVITQIDSLLQQARNPARSLTGNPSKQAATKSSSPTPPSRDPVSSTSPSSRSPSAAETGSSTASPSKRSQANNTVTVRREALKRAPWGHLPPALRSRLMNSQRERPPSKYVSRVRRYYESLATGTRRRQGTP